MLSARNPNELPEFDLSQDEVKNLVALCGIMAMTIHYGVDPNVPADALPKDIEENGGMLGLMMNGIRAADKAGDLIHDIIERTEKAEIDKLNETFDKIVNPSE
jgi:hypothetical protein